MTPFRSFVIRAAAGVALVVGGGAAFLFIGSWLVGGSRVIQVPVDRPLSSNGNNGAATGTAPSGEASSSPVADANSGRASSSAPGAERPSGSVRVPDDPPQPQLPNPPDIVKGVYLTSWSAGYAPRITAITNLIDRTPLNAVVIDIKDFSGNVSYHTNAPEVAAVGAENDIRIARPNALIKQLHEKGIYVIGRITVFQDPILAAAHPEWAIQDKTKGGVWRDHKGIAWLDAAARPVWDYHVALARDAFARGFDEVNFDYIRFPSDGNLQNTKYPFWDEVTPQRKTIRAFFEYLRRELPGRKISADLFGLTTSAADDLGIGQKIEDAYPNFDFICPMVYPSHFASGYIGYAQPAKFPGEVIRHSMSEALRKLRALAITLSPSVTVGTSTVPASVPDPSVLARMGKLRPWLQAFDLGATYDTAKIQAQIAAAEEVLGASGAYAGWLLWDPKNTYVHYQ